MGGWGIADAHCTAWDVCVPGCALSHALSRDVQRGGSRCRVCLLLATAHEALSLEGWELWLVVADFGGDEQSSSRAVLDVEK